MRPLIKTTVQTFCAVSCATHHGAVCSGQSDGAHVHAACFTADNTTGAPFAPAKCPPGSCVSSLQTQTGSYHNPLYDQDALIPIFYSITIICTDVSSGLATSQLVEGFGSNGTNGVFINPGYEVLEAPSGCLTGMLCTQFSLLHQTCLIHALLYAKSQNILALSESSHAIISTEELDHDSMS